MLAVLAHGLLLLRVNVVFSRIAHVVFLVHVVLATCIDRAIASQLLADFCGHVSGSEWEATEKVRVPNTCVHDNQLQG
jgi:hypothetical protein